MAQQTSLEDFPRLPNETDDSPRVTRFLATLAPGTDAANPTLVVPRGRYELATTVVAPNGASNFLLTGSGGRSSVFVWRGEAGHPMLRLINANTAWISGLGFRGAARVPSYGIEVQVNAPEGAAPKRCRIERCRFGGDGTGTAIDVGVGFTAARSATRTWDQNNEQSLITDSEFDYCLSAGVRFEHSNSLWHRVEGCGFSACGAGVSNVAPKTAATPGYGGGFSARGCRFGGNHAAFEIGPSRYMIVIDECYSETDQHFVFTPAPITSGYAPLIIRACAPTTDDRSIVWHSSVGGDKQWLSLTDCRFAGKNTTIECEGTDPVALDRVSGADVKSNGRVVWRNVPGGGGNGAPLITSATPGEHHAPSRFDNMGWASAVPDLPEGEAPSVHGIPHTGLAKVPGGRRGYSITRLSDGFAGQEITLVFASVNTRLHHGANLVLRHAEDFVSSANATLTLRCLYEDPQVPGALWIETSRSL